MTDPLLMIGIDAADRAIVLDLAARGRMPTLARLIERGHVAELSSPGNAYAGGVWPSFYTSRSIEQHGLYHSKLWRSETMRIEVPKPDWIAATPFHRHFQDRGVRMWTLDLPMLIEQPEGIDGRHLLGWGTHDLIARHASPRSLWGDLVGKFGSPLMPAEHFGRQTAGSLLRLRKDLLGATVQAGEVARHLLGAQAWDFGLAVFGAAHRAGHYLWDKSEIDISRSSAGENRLLETGLVTILEAVDRELEKLVRSAPANCRILVFAVHGMDANPGWADHGAELLDSITHRLEGRIPPRGMLYSIKRHLPIEWVRPLLRRLPPLLTGELVSLWSKGMFDWSRTRHFALPMDHAGFIRLNLKNREPNGIIDPGEDYENHLARLAAIFQSLVCESTGRKIVELVQFPYRDDGDLAAARERLPDLLIVWGRHQRAIRTARLVSPLLPGWSFDVDHPSPSGRSGNHNGRAWLVASGPGIKPASGSDRHDIVDIVPTAARLLGIRPAPEWQGSAMEALFA